MTSTRVVGDRVFVQDQGSAGSHGYRLEPGTTLARDGSPFTLSRIETLDLTSANAGANTFTISGYTEPLQNITIAGGTGPDVFSATNIVVDSVISGSAQNANVVFRGRTGGDAATADVLPSSVTILNGNEDDDSMEVNNVGAGAGAAINADTGNDTLRLFSSEPGSEIVLIGGADNDTITVNSGQQGNVCTDQTPTAARLQSMSARRQGRAVVVAWRTATEVNVAGFNVFRKHAGRQTRVNRKLIAAAGGTSGHAYRLRDAAAPRGSVRYRVQAVANSGRVIWLGSATAR